MNYTILLKELGLTDGEIKTYLALLQLGESSTGSISKESQVSRSKLYIILDKLEKKGLVSHIEKNGITYFQAAEPARIKDYLKIKEDNFVLLKKNVKDAILKLESIYKNVGQIHNVSVYQGLKGLITAHEHLYLKLKKGEEYYYFGIPSFQPESHHLYWQKDHKRRVKAGIKCKLLFNRDTPKEVLINRNSYSLCDARYMPPKIKTPSYFLVYKDTAIIAIPSTNPIAIEITNQEVADSFKAYFEEFWRLTKNKKET